jgi:hypothetical protein
MACRLDGNRTAGADRAETAGEVALIDVPKGTEIVGYLASLPGRGRITSVRLGFFRGKWRPRGGRRFREAAWQIPSN